MKRAIFARIELIDRACGSEGRSLLLEGSWPEDCPAADRRSLDDALDARFRWIDEEASRLAERLGGMGFRQSVSRSADMENDSRPPPLLAGLEGVNPFWLAAPALRYYLVRLMRLVVYFTEVESLGRGDCVDLGAARGRDEDYAFLLGAMCRLAEAELHTWWVDAPLPPAAPLPPNRLWRRCAAWLAERLQPRGPRLRRAPVVLCGNPRLLDPVCRELLARGVPTWWLYDRFAVGTWLRWGLWGAGQLLCQGGLGRANRLGLPGTVPFFVANDRAKNIFRRMDLQVRSHGRLLGDGPGGPSYAESGSNSFAGPNDPPVPTGADDGKGDGALRAPLFFRGVDLAAPLGRWIACWLQAHGPRLARIGRQLHAHFRRLRPRAVVLDEDATPMNRAAVLLARRHGAPSFVVQHGAPCCRFGFAPPAADRLLVWGEASRRQLLDWGVPADRIVVTGSPWHEGLLTAVRRRRLVPNPLSLRERVGVRGEQPQNDPTPSVAEHVASSSDAAAIHVACSPRPYPGPLPEGEGARRILLLTTVLPRDDRPDALELHLNRASYAEMLRVALAAVARLANAELMVRPHPRASHDPILAAALASFPQVRARVARGGSLQRCLRQADCVLSCLSTAGVDAAVAGLPVIQLLPVGSGDILPHHAWGLLGTARTEEELLALLAAHICRSPSLERAENRLAERDAYDVRRQPAADAVSIEPAPAASRIVQAVLDGHLAGGLARRAGGVTTPLVPFAAGKPAG